VPWLVFEKDGDREEEHSVGTSVKTAAKEQTACAFATSALPPAAYPSMARGAGGGRNASRHHADAALAQTSPA